MDDPVSVFTLNPEALYGVSHIALAPTHRYNNPKFYKVELQNDSHYNQDIIYI